MVAYTTTYNLKKPTVADDEDVWGGYLNDSMDIIDDVLDGTVPVTGIDINSGTLDNVVIGGANANTGTFTVLTANTSLGVTGNITVSGTVDGRDVAADGTKLDGIESGATADQTKADIDALGIAASTAATLATARNIALTGAVTGNVNFDGSGNVSISTTATSDPTLTLSGDASGSATFTNLGNATLSVTVADDSHNHVISNVDGLQTALDGKLGSTAKAADSNLLDGLDSSQFLRSDTSDTVAAGRQISYYCNDVMETNSGDQSSLEVFQDTSGADAFMQFHVQGDFAAYFGLKGDINDFAVGGWSMGNTYHRVWHAGNDGSGSGLDADTVDGVHESTFMRKSANSSLDMNNNNITDVEDIYLQDRIYHDGDTDTYIQFGTNEFNVYTGGSREITVNTTGVRLGDTGNGYFQPVSGNYGSIQIDGGAHGGYEGYSIGGHDVFMANGTDVGIYNDANNEWLFRASHNGTSELYHNGSSKLDTLSNGVSINGNLYTDGSNAEDYDALSGTSPTCNVDNAGAFSLTMTGNTTFTFSGADSGWSMGFVLQLTGNGSTVTWPSSVDWAGGTAPDAPASGETDIYVFWTRDGGTTWYGVQSIDAAA
jgi:hypothetical protein